MPASTRTTTPQVTEPAPELFPIHRLEWRRAARLLTRAGLLATPVAVAGLLNFTTLSVATLAYWALTVLFYAAVAAVALMLLTCLALLIVKVMRSVRGVGRWLTS